MTLNLMFEFESIFPISDFTKSDCLVNFLLELKALLVNLTCLVLFLSTMDLGALDLDDEHVREARGGER